MEQPDQQTDSDSTRRVVLYELMSLDGFADDPGEGDWLRNTGDGIGGFLSDTIATQDTVLLGRRTYEKWAPYWPTADVQPFAHFINSTPKLVFSSRPLQLGWARTTQVTEPPAGFVRELKARAGGDIGIHGSLSLARALLGADLVDELRLVVAPTLAGHGKRLFSDDAPLRAFELAGCERSGGCLLLTYGRVRER